MKEQPNFIICGAMKTGTTSLHHLLNQQDLFYLPNGEIHYFCVDDMSQHYPYRGRKTGQWYYSSFDGPEMNDWYRSHFKGASNGQLVGEDSTVYMASAFAPQRIQVMLPDVKLIFVLRNPVDRLWSHYWHLVRTGRAMFSLDKMLEIQASTLLVRGHYKEQIDRYLQFFPMEQMKFVLLEDIKSNPHGVVSGVADWLGRPLKEKDVHFTKTHFHQGRYPRSLSIQLWRNRLLQGLDRRLYCSHYPDGINALDLPSGVVARVIEKLFIKLNPHDARSSRIEMETRELLSDYYQERNKGLGELIGRPEVDAWY